METKMTINEFKNVFTYLLDNNRRLADAGMSPIAVGLEGEAGLGKTSVITQIAKERGMTLCKLNLSQLEEVGDLTGLPVKEYEVAWIENGTVKEKRWMQEIQVTSLKPQLRLTGRTRMSYAPPAWLPAEENPNGTVVLLDDFSRANNMFMQAIMELINEGQYISWKLPKYTSIVLSSNPDDGQYQVSSLDDAQKTRFVNFSISFNIKNWVDWAESTGIDDRAINFAMLNAEELFTRKNNVIIANPRSYTTFCKAISGIEDWEKPDNLALILQISSGCFLNDTDNVTGSMFTQFVANRLDKLPLPEEMMTLPWTTLKNRMKECLYKESTYKPEIAGILTTRLCNYILTQFGIKGALNEQTVTSRIEEIVSCDETLFTEDLIFYLVKTLVTKYPGKTSSLLANSKIRNKIIL